MVTSYDLRPGNGVSLFWKEKISKESFKKTHIHTHNHFTAFWTLSGTIRVSQYQKVHFAFLWIFWSKMKITQADAPTIWMDYHPIQTN